MLPLHFSSLSRDTPKRLFAFKILDSDHSADRSSVVRAKVRTIKRRAICVLWSPSYAVSATIKLGISLRGMALWLRDLAGELSAPLRPADGSYFESPFAIAYRKICPQVCRSRRAVSTTPRFSTFLRTSRSSGAPISAMGLNAKSGKTSASRRPCNKAKYLDARRRCWRSSHSRATASNVLLLANLAARFLSLLAAFGSLPSARNLRAASRRSLPGERKGHCRINSECQCATFAVEPIVKTPISRTILCHQEVHTGAVA
jgi:hypothetical protein